MQKLTPPFCAQSAPVEIAQPAVVENAQPAPVQNVAEDAEDNSGISPHPKFRIGEKI